MSLAAYQQYDNTELLDEIVSMTTSNGAVCTSLFTIPQLQYNPLIIHIDINTQMQCSSNTPNADSIIAQLGLAISDQLASNTTDTSNPILQYATCVAYACCDGSVVYTTDSNGRLSCNICTNGAGSLENIVIISICSAVGGIILVIVISYYVDKYKKSHNQNNVDQVHKRGYLPPPADLQGAVFKTKSKQKSQLPYDNITPLPYTTPNQRHCHTAVSPLRIEPNNQQLDTMFMSPPVPDGPNPYSNDSVTPLPTIQCSPQTSTQLYHNTIHHDSEQLPSLHYTHHTGLNTVSSINNHHHNSNNQHGYHTTDAISNDPSTQPHDTDQISKRQLIALQLQSYESGHPSIKSDPSIRSKRHIPQSTQPIKLQPLQQSQPQLPSDNNKLPAPYYSNSNAPQRHRLQQHINELDSLQSIHPRQNHSIHGI